MKVAVLKSYFARVVAGKFFYVEANWGHNFCLKTTMMTIRDFCRRWRWVAAWLLLGLGPCGVSGQSGKTVLIGTVVGDDMQGISGARIHATGMKGGLSTTDGDGTFRLEFGDLKEGSRVILKVTHPTESLVMLYPFDGQVNLPVWEFRKDHQQTIVMVPKGSKTTWTHQRLTRYIKALKGAMESSKAEALEAAKFKRVLSKIFDVDRDEVNEMMEEWLVLKETSQIETERALAAFVRRKWSEAALHFEKAAEADGAQADQLESEANKKRTDQYEKLTNSGRSWMELGQYDHALSAFQSCENELKKSYAPTLRAQNKVHLSEIHRELLCITNGEKIQSHYNSGLDAAKFARSHFESKGPPHWRFQSLLALASIRHAYAARQTGRESIQLLRNAIADIDSLTEHPLVSGSAVQSGRLQLQRSHMYADLSWRLERDSVGIVLNAALGNVNAALSTVARSEAPRLHLRISLQKARLLTRLGNRREDAKGFESLEEALKSLDLAHRSHGEIFSDNRLSKARFHAVRGEARLYKARRRSQETATMLLRAAQDDIQIVLDSLTPRYHAQELGHAQRIAGMIYAQRAIITSGKHRILLRDSAIKAYQNALLLLSRDHTPYQWALTHNYLGIALQQAATRADSLQHRIALLNSSIHQFDSALTVYQRRSSPQRYAKTRSNLGSTYRELAHNLSGTGRWDAYLKAINNFDEALRIRTISAFPSEHAETLFNRGLTWTDMANDTTGKEKQNFLHRAIRDLGSVLEIITPATRLKRWLDTQLEIAGAHAKLSSLMAQASARKQLGAAIAAYDNAWQNADSLDAWTRARYALNRATYLTAIGELSCEDDSAAAAYFQRAGDDIAAATAFFNPSDYRIEWIICQLNAAYVQACMARFTPKQSLAGGLAILDSVVARIDTTTESYWYSECLAAQAWLHLQCSNPSAPAQTERLALVRSLLCRSEALYPGEMEGKWGKYRRMELELLLREACLENTGAQEAWHKARALSEALLELHPADEFPQEWGRLRWRQGLLALSIGGRKGWLRAMRDAATTGTCFR